MKDNYERDEKLSMCDDCINRFNWEKCNTCKHRKKFTQVPGTYPQPSPFPIWPFEPYRTIPLRYPNAKYTSTTSISQSKTKKKGGKHE